VEVLFQGVWVAVEQPQPVEHIPVTAPVKQHLQGTPQAGRQAQPSLAVNAFLNSEAQASAAAAHCHVVAQLPLPSHSRSAPIQLQLW
jgi:hypothetical protein